MNSQRLMVQFVLTFCFPPFLLLYFYYKGSYIRKIDTSLLDAYEISQPLVTILPEGSKNKIVLHLNPSDVKQLEVGKEGSIRFQGEQKKAVKVKVTKISIIPTTTKISKDNKKEEVINVYEAEVEILSNGEEIAYGMLGIAEVKIGRETMWNYIKRHLFGGSKVSI